MKYPNFIVSIVCMSLHPVSHPTHTARSQRQIMRQKHVTSQTWLPSLYLFIWVFGSQESSLITGLVLLQSSMTEENIFLKTPKAIQDVWGNFQKCTVNTNLSATYTFQRQHWNINMVIFTLELQNMSAVMENVWNCAHKYAGVIYHILMCACLEKSGTVIFYYEGDVAFSLCIYCDISELESK